MKVLCIDAKPKGNYILAPWILVEGDLFTRLRIVNKYGETWYELAEQIGVGYPSSHFALTSDIDETELAEQRELQTV